MLLRLLLVALMLAAAPARAQPVELFPTVMDISLPAGTGRLLQLPAAANTIMAANPEVVRVQPTSPTTMFIMGVNPGRTNIIATNNEGRPIVEFNVTVTGTGPAAGARGVTPQAQRQAQASIAQLQSLLRQSLPGAQNVTLRSVAGRVVVSGTVPTAEDARRVMAVLGTALGDEPVVNDLAVLSALTVNVRVRVAEISRQITRELGFSWSTFGSVGSFAIGMQSGLNLLGAPSTLPFGLAGPGNLYPSRGGGLGLGFPASDINALIDALARDSLITILAEPNLTALSGETASFLAGGEFPIPVASGLAGQLAIQFRQFGVSLAFVPTVLSPDRLNLRIRPEVSELSEQGAISLPIPGGQAIRVPALAVRRAETTVELGSGQSFAIAGLLQRSSAQVLDGPFGLADIPILGALFRSDRFRRNETELVIIVTPYIVRPVSDPTALATPMDHFRAPNDLERILQRRQLGAPRPPVQLPRDAGFILD
ncbi:MAG: type II and III secretion system protein family protein [Rhodovarius sp.]|nr:type II and III secretion system protein family protein [Rhodovarius sp.]